MILYLDTSALVKAYVTESFSKEINKAIKNATVVASHRIAFVEARAAFSRLHRENKLTEKQYNSLKKSFDADWDNYLHVESTQTIMEHAANLAEAFALRAYDSVHLSSADILLKKSEQKVIFACFDQKLNQAANVLGLKNLI